MDELAEVEPFDLEILGPHGPDPDVGKAVGHTHDADKEGPLGGNCRGVLLDRDRFTRVRHVPFSAVPFESISFERRKSEGLWPLSNLWPAYHFRHREGRRRYFSKSPPEYQFFLLKAGRCLIKDEMNQPLKNGRQKTGWGLLLLPRGSLY
jgi:hypothetical protein